MLAGLTHVGRFEGRVGGIDAYAVGTQGQS
jgi:hypothetical protein